MKQKKNNIRIIITICLCFCFFALIYMASLLNIYLTSNNDLNTKSNNSKIKEIIEAYNSIYISEKSSNDNNYYIDIYAILGTLPFEIDESTKDDNMIIEKTNNNDNSDNTIDIEKNENNDENILNNSEIENITEKNINNNENENNTDNTINNSEIENITENYINNNENENNINDSENESTNDSNITSEKNLNYRSNEKYYNNLLNDIAEVIEYKNYRLIDNKNNINIEVICKDNEIDSIIINGIEDYFIYMGSELSFKNFKEIDITTLDVTSNILNECINNKNTKKINFGTKDSSFERYDIYFDEGIYVRKNQNSIYNIIFSNNYKDEIFKNIHTGMENEAIIETLGIPTFSDNELNLIGYKGTDVYAFFYNGMISIYKLEKEVNFNDFLKLVDTYLTQKEQNLLEFMNELTYLWPDYSDYEYSSNYFFIAYPLKAVEIKLNYDDTNGILVYNNIKDISAIKDYLTNTDFIGCFEKDSIFEAEKRRINKENGVINTITEYLDSLSDEEKNLIGDSIQYSVLPEKDENDKIYNLKFISKTGEKPNRELYDGINSYLWISDSILIYSKYKSGIYKYNLEDGKVSRLIEGLEEYNFIKYEDGILTYDKDNTVEIR